MLDFLRRNRVLLVSALCLLLGAALVVRTSAARDHADALTRLFLELMAPLQRAATAVERAVGGSWRSVAELLHTRRENAVLRARVRGLQRELDRVAEVASENERLRALLDFRRTLEGEFLTARVIGHDATGLARTLLIDRGEDDGIVKGAAVLAPAGIVGQVFVTGRRSARVLLISDHNSGVDAIVQRTRARGIVQGTVDAGCTLKYVKRTEDVRVGDTVITSGLDGIFPKGMAIGVVTMIDKRGRGLFQNAEVAPRVDAERLEELLVARAPVAPVEQLPVE